MEAYRERDAMGRETLVERVFAATIAKTSDNISDLYKPADATDGYDEMEVGR
jgi:hypothetical protein